MQASQCPRCHELGTMAEEIALFPQTRTCGACDEYQRRCLGCYGWFAETDLTVIDHSPTCGDCEEMTKDYAREDAERAVEQRAMFNALALGRRTWEER